MEYLVLFTIVSKASRCKLLIVFKARVNTDSDKMLIAPSNWQRVKLARLVMGRYRTEPIPIGSGALWGKRATNSNIKKHYTKCVIHFV